MRALACRQRRRCGRRAAPRLAIIDTQSVTCISVRGPRGYDAAKKVVERNGSTGHHEGVALVDAEGHVLALAVVPINVRDRDTLPTLEGGNEQWPSLRLAILASPVAVERCHAWCNIYGMRRRVVEKEHDQKSFVGLKRHWVVERMFG